MPNLTEAEDWRSESMAAADPFGVDPICGGVLGFWQRMTEEMGNGNGVWRFGVLQSEEDSEREVEGRGRRR